MTTMGGSLVGSIIDVPSCRRNELGRRLLTTNAETKLDLDEPTLICGGKSTATAAATTVMTILILFI
jgi:hypothetical protein